MGGGGGMSMSMGLAEPEEAPEGTRDLEVDLEAAIAPPT